MRLPAILLAASIAAPVPAWAQTAAPIVAQLRLPAREMIIDVIAWRTDAGIEVARADLRRLTIVAPPGASERIALADVPGLSFREDTASQAIILTCAGECLAPQRLGAAPETPRAIDRASGAYLNYDFDVQWLEGRDIAASSIAEAAAFGRFGLIESGWIGIADGDAPRITRLETRWTIDRPEDQIRLQLGDASTLTAGGVPLRFAGVQIGRHFGLAPARITHPTALLSGEAASASTVELYVNGALRARERVAAGPFVFEDAPLVTGAGEAQLVITDLAGRQQLIARPFFVSTALLRPGLADWSVSAGVERLDFGAADFSYGDAFLSSRYRRGLADFFTAEAALDLHDGHAVAQASATFAHVVFGQVRVGHARDSQGGASEIAWFQDADAWSFGVQADSRDETFRPLGRSESDLRRSIAGNVQIELGAFGAAALTAASVEFFEEEDARTLTLAYAPDLAEGSLSARLIYTEGEEREWAFALTFSAAIDRHVSASVGLERDRDGFTYRAAAQRAPDFEGGLGWRARIAEGERQHAEFAASLRGRTGYSAAQIARADGALGARIGHSGSIGIIEGRTFAAPPIHGAFALVDVGAPGVSVLRDRFSVGETGDDGRVIVTGLRPYDSNIIAISADDLPFDRSPIASESSVTPREGAGVIVSFTHETEQLMETRAAFAHGEPAPRGAVLVRLRDGARFPVGRDGRIVLRGARRDDVVRLDRDARCTAAASPERAANGLVLHCEAS